MINTHNLSQRSALVVIFTLLWCLGWNTSTAGGKGFGWTEEAAVSLPWCLVHQVSLSSCFWTQVCLLFKFLQDTWLVAIIAYPDAKNDFSSDNLLFVCPDRFSLVVSQCVLKNGNGFAAKGQGRPDMEFLDINVTKNPSILLHAIHSLRFNGRF